MTTEQQLREAFDKWYYNQWSYGETSPVHEAHKKGCWLAWQAALALPSQRPDDEGVLQATLKGIIPKYRWGENLHEVTLEIIDAIRPCLRAKPDVGLGASLETLETPPADEQSTGYRNGSPKMGAAVPEHQHTCAGAGKGVVNALKLVNEQANDEGLWCAPENIVEDALQKALRRLHEAVEGKSQEECAIAALAQGKVSV